MMPILNLLAHLGAMPIGWHDGKLIRCVDTSEADVVAWLQRLKELHAAVLASQEHRPDTCLREGQWYAGEMGGGVWEAWHKVGDQCVAFSFREDVDDMIKLLGQVRERIAGTGADTPVPFCGARVFARFCDMPADHDGPCSCK